MATTFAQAPLTLVPRVAFVAGVAAFLGSLAPPAGAQTTVYDSTNPVYAGGTIAPGGTVILNDGSQVTGNVRVNGTLQFNQTGLLTISSTISGTGTLSLTNTGTLNLSGTTAAAGTVVLNMVTSASAGLLQIRSGSGDLRIGNNGTGTLNVGGGGVTSRFLYVGYYTTGTAYGTGTLKITGGTVSTGSMGYIGPSRFSEGSATVTGGTWAIASGLEVATSGRGTLTIAGGTVVCPIYSTIGGTYSTASVGTATVSSGSWATGILTIGRTGKGTLDVTGGSVTSHSANILDAVTVSGGRWDVTNRLTLAGYTGSSPLSPRRATLHIDGGSVTAGDARLGDDSSDRAIAIATVSSGTLTVGGEFRIANSHQGELNVLGGSVITGSTAYIGMFSDALGTTSVGTATVSSGGWAIGGDLVIGNAGIGTLTVNGGSVTTASNAYLGKNLSGVGTASVSSGTLAVAGDLVIGMNGDTGTLNVNGGTVTTGSTAYLGYYSGTSNATVSSGTWAIGGDLIVGGIYGSSAATLTMDGGLVSVSGTLDQRGGTIDLNAGGTLQIGTGGDGGVLAVSALVNDGTLVFDRSGASAYAGNSSGTGGIVKRGSGTLTLAGSNSHSGPTTVAAGALLVDGVVTASAVTVQGGALVGGSGTIGTLLTVQSGGTLSPGDSPGLLTVGTLDLRPGSTTLMEIIGVGGAAGVAGVDYDRVVVTTAGGLGYGGLLDLDFGNLTTFADGTTFDLFGFSGFPTGFFTSVITSGSGSYAGLTLHGTGGLWTGAAAGQTISFDESTGILRFGSAAVPEIDPAGLGSVVGLVIGALGLLERRRSKPA